MARVTQTAYYQVQFQNEEGWCKEKYSTKYVLRFTFDDEFKSEVGSRNRFHGKVTAERTWTSEGERRWHERIPPSKWSHDWGYPQTTRDITGMITILPENIEDVFTKPPETLTPAKFNFTINHIEIDHPPLPPAERKPYMVMVTFESGFDGKSMVLQGKKEFPGTSLFEGFAIGGCTSWSLGETQEESGAVTKISWYIPKLTEEGEECEECGLEITDPFNGDNFTFENGSLTIQAEAKVKPESEIENLVWEVDDIEDSMTILPSKQGTDFIDIRYEGLPIDNDSLGSKKIQASISSKDCSASSKITVKTLFKKDDQDNPKGQEPNWFYYWMQTVAGKGYPAVYDNESKCARNKNGETVLGHYVPGEKKFHICDKASTMDINLLLLRMTSGIDTFASTVRHENDHLVRYWDWWTEGYEPLRDLNGDGMFMGNDEIIDFDRDFVPDFLEGSLGLNNRLWDSCNLGLPDFECLAYRAEAQWSPGAADQTDWANPGKQSN